MNREYVSRDNSRPAVRIQRALSGLVFVTGLGRRLQSATLALWVAGLFAPAMLVLLKRVRAEGIGCSIWACPTAHRANTPVLLPRNPQGRLRAIV